MRILLSLVTLVIFSSLNAQRLAERQVIKIHATPDASSGSITLNWESLGSGSINISKREDLGTNSWDTTLATLPGSATTYTDSTAEPGHAYEYFIQHGTSSIGYIYAGNEKEAEHNFYGIIVLVDSTYKDVLANEIDRLMDDLKADGWYPELMYCGRNETPPAIKTRIGLKVDEMDYLTQSLLILGHVPVPYSGAFTGAGHPPPDGHVEGSGNHTGAWAADVYYGDLDGNWTDNSVNITTGNQARNHNVPGDGKFDQTRIPSDVELQVGRVDFYDMPEFDDSDTLLLKKYLDRNHLWRRGKLKSVNRALIDNNFSGLNLASTGWHNFTTFFPKDSISITADYFTAMKDAPYLWSYGCGAGSYRSCNGIGHTRDFAADSLQSIFTILAGSYFGDWDVRDNFLRAPLANSALLSFWGGIPKWYVHTMAMGKNVGFGTKVSQNNTGFYYTGAFNASHNLIHIALMGDPSLTMSCFEGPSNLRANAGTDVYLEWSPSPEMVDGYYVYEVQNGRTLKLLTPNPIQDTSYLFAPQDTGTYEYMVRATRLESNASGTYYNLSPGVSTNVWYTYTASIQESNSDLPMVKIFPNPSQGQFFIQSDAELSDLFIADLNGRIMFHASQGQLNRQRFETSLANGLYLVQIETSDGQRLTKRLIIK
jgi:hypothetical protein